MTKALNLVLLTILVGGCARTAIMNNDQMALRLVEDHQTPPVYRVFYDPVREQYIIRSWSYDHASEVMRELCDDEGIICAAQPAGVVLHVDVLADLRGGLK